MQVFGSRTGRRRSQCVLRENLTRSEGDSGNGQRHDQAADDHGFFSGNIQGPAVYRSKRDFRIMAFCS
jgi:hypothetical protein